MSSRRTIPMFGRLASVLVGCVALSACSGPPPLVSVKATVLLDGKPISDVHVCFWAVEKGDPSRTGYGLGISGPDGTIVVKDPFGKEGLFPGKYKVSFSRWVSAQGTPISVNAKPSDVYGGARDQMPKKYQSEGTTDIVIDVSPAGLETTFDLKSK